MTIHSKTPLTIAEAYDIVKTLEEKQELKDYFKTFVKLSKEKAQQLAGEIRALNNPKLNDEHVIKIVDFLPTEAEELNKVLRDAGLTEVETNAVLELVKKY